MVEFLIGDPQPRTIPALISARDELHVPPHCDAELVSGLRSATAVRRISAQMAEHAIADYIDLPIVRHAGPGLLMRTFQLREHFSAYEAAYVALAEHLRALFLTADGRLARAVQTHTTVELVT